MLSMICGDCHLCWVSHNRPLCWVSLFWISSRWVSWRLDKHSSFLWFRVKWLIQNHNFFLNKVVHSELEANSEASLNVSLYQKLCFRRNYIFLPINHIVRPYPWFRHSNNSITCNIGKNESSYYPGMAINYCLLETIFYKKHLL